MSENARVAGGRARALHLPLALGCCAALAARFCFFPLGETDAGWHVALGRLLLAGHLPRTNTLSWTAAGFPWYPTSWLFDIACAVAARAGPFGLELLTAALFVLTLSGVMLACRRASGEPWTVWLAVPAFFGLLPQAVVRPHVASWLVLAAVLALGLRGCAWRPDAGARGSPVAPARLWALLVVALGSNLHAGAAFASFALGCFALQAALEARREGRSPLPEVLLFAAAPLALLANPGGLFNLNYLFDHLHVQQVVPLVEFERPTLLGDPVFFSLVVPCTALALWRLRASPGLSVLVLVYTALGLRTQRLTQLLLLVAPVLLAEVLPPLLEKLPSALPRARAAALLVLLLTGLSALGAEVGRRLHFPHEARWHLATQPVRAARFLDAHGLDGRGFNSLGDGGYLEYARPGVPTFADGRLQAFPDGFFPAWMAAEKNGESFRAFLQSYDVEWALCTRLKERLGGYRLLDSPKWALVYWDETSEVWLRRDVPRFAKLITDLEYRLFRPYGSIVGKVAAQDLEGLRAMDKEVARFLSAVPDEPFALVVACGSAVRQGRVDAGALCERAQAQALAQGRADAAALVQKARGLGAAER